MVVLEESISSTASRNISDGSIADCVISELNERHRKSCNVIIHGMPEISEVPLKQRNLRDTDSSKALLGAVYDSDYSSILTRRLGKANGPSPRPLCVGLSSTELVRKVLVNKFKNTGPMKISDVKTRL